MTTESKSTNHVGASPKPVAGTTTRMTRVRKIIAQRMTESLREAAQLTATQEVDVTDLGALRDRAKVAFKQEEGVALTYLAFFSSALIRAASQFPEFTASIDAEGKTVTYHEAVHLGIAVDTPSGLVVPVLKNAETLSLRDIAFGIADLARRVREGDVTPDMMSGSTITVSNIGGAGNLTDTCIINYPEVAILGTGAVVRRPRVVVGSDGVEQIAIRSVCTLPLTYDHRLIDGVAAGRFLTSVKRYLDPTEFQVELARYLA